MDKVGYKTDDKPLGNHPKPPVKKAGKPIVPREPKKLQVKKRVMGKWKTHPVDKMVRIANFIEASNPELAAKIWMRLLDSCELEEKAKKGYMPPPAGNESAAEAEAMKALEELENGAERKPQNLDAPMVSKEPGIDPSKAEEVETGE